MDNKISITQPEIFTPDREGFHPFRLKISKDEINSEQQLYFHKCLNAEYQEYSSARWEEPDVIRQSEENLQTVYFYNDETDYSAIQPTSQLNSKRTDEVAEEDVEERSDIPTTLYFINEEDPPGPEPPGPEPPGPEPEPDYYDIEWIESSGTQYIDTDIYYHSGPQRLEATFTLQGDITNIYIYGEDNDPCNPDSIKCMFMGNCIYSTYQGNTGWAGVWPPGDTSSTAPALRPIIKGFGLKRVHNNTSNSTLYYVIPYDQSYADCWTNLIHLETPENTTYKTVKRTISEANHGWSHFRMESNIQVDSYVTRLYGLSTSNIPHTIAGEPCTPLRLFGFKGRDLGDVTVQGNTWKDVKWNDTIFDYCHLRLYGIRILAEDYENNPIVPQNAWSLDGDEVTVLHNLVPKLRSSDMKPGLLDTVTNKFYTNDGTGEFLYELVQQN